MIDCNVIWCELGPFVAVTIIVFGCCSCNLNRYWVEICTENGYLLHWPAKHQATEHLNRNDGAKKCSSFCMFPSNLDSVRVFTLFIPHSSALAIRILYFTMWLFKLMFIVVAICASSCSLFLLFLLAWSPLSLAPCLTLVYSFLVHVARLAVVLSVQFNFDYYWDSNTKKRLRDTNSGL